MRKVLAPLRSERGMSVVLVAISLTGLMSVVALAIDVGMLLTARSEAQRTADAAALAGAGSLIPAPNDADRARNVAIQYGGLNDVQNMPVTILPQDVQVDLAQQMVTVSVRRAADRGNAITTWFARIFGVDAVDVAARAAARVQPAGSAMCVKPFSIFDRFIDVDQDAVFEPGEGDQYDPLVHGYGSSWGDNDGTGYVEDFGRPIVLKGTNGNAYDGCCPGTGPSWHYPWDIPQPAGGPSSGAARYRWNIANCNTSLISVGEEYQVEPGTMHGPTVQGVEDLIAQDPGAHWDPQTNTIEGSDWAPNWEGSPRIGIIPTFHPGRQFDPGRQPIEFTNFLAVFIESVSGNGNKQVVHGRIMYVAGVAGATGNGNSAKFVQLVE